MRLFIAIELPAELKAAFTTLKSGIAGARWVPVEQLHLTLAFLGEVDETTREQLSASLAEIRIPGFTLCCSGFGCFPNMRHPRVIWAGLKPEPLLMVLAAQVRQAVVAVGIPQEERRFTPHITLARFHQIPAKDTGSMLARLDLPELPPVSVKEFILYCSSLTPYGAVHTQLRTYPLLSADNLPEND